VSESRKDPRSAVTLVARYRSPTALAFVEEECTNLSRGGMFILSGNPPPAGSLLKLECHASPDEARIAAVVRVIWIRPEPEGEWPSGLGVKFIKLDAGGAEVIERIIGRVASPEGGTPVGRPDSPPSTGAAVEEPAPIEESGAEDEPGETAEESATVERETAEESATVEESGAEDEPEEPAEEAARSGKNTAAAATDVSPGDRLRIPRRRPRDSDPPWKIELPESVLRADDDYRRPFRWRAVAVSAIALLLLGGGAYGGYTYYLKMKRSGERPATAGAPAPAKPEPPYPAPAETPAPEATPAATPEADASPDGEKPGPADESAPAPAETTTPAATPAAEKPPTAPSTAARPPPRVKTRAPARSRPRRAKKEAPAGPAEPEQSRLEKAMACIAAGDNACVIRTLEGKARTARELGLLIETYRSMGNTAKARKHMADFVKRYPTRRQANSYHRILERGE
jgi:hypothetical protein